MDYWSDWHNTHNPSVGRGDDETVQTIEQIDGPVCRHGYSVWRSQCRDIATGMTFSEASPLMDSPEHVRLREGCSAQGLLCVNDDQPINAGERVCPDYEIRFYCQHDSNFNDQSTSIFPDFDARIYIILAIVPIAIFLLRLLWACVYRRRRAQRRLRRRAARLRGRTVSHSSSISDEDNYSVNTELANPPPSYLDLFGDVPNEQNTRSVFVIGAESMPVCPHCIGKSCSVTSNPRVHRISFTEAPLSRTDSRILDMSESRGNFKTANNSENPTPRVQDRETGSFSVEMSPMAGASAASSSTDNNLAHEQSSDTNEQHSRDSAVSHNDTAIPSGAGAQQNNPSSTVTSTPTASPLNVALMSTASYSCQCQCHRNMSFVTASPRQYDNGGFSNDDDTTFSRIPGMHVAAFPRMHRTFSNMSVVSTVTLSELPSYEDALEIIKKKEQGPDQ